jgi:hypothetical protein
VTEILDSNKDGALSLQEFRQTGWFLNVTVKDFENLLPLNTLCKEVWNEIEYFKHNKADKSKKSKVEKKLNLPRS